MAAREIGLAFIFGFRLLQRRLRGGLGGLRPLELELVRLGLDDEERRSFLYLLALLVVDLLQEPLHARDQIGGVYRRRVAGGLEVAGDLLLHRNGDGDLRRRRRYVVVLLPAGAERRGERACDGAGGKLRTRRPIDPHRTTLNCDVAGLL